MQKKVERSEDLEGPKAVARCQWGAVTSAEDSVLSARTVVSNKDTQRAAEEGLEAEKEKKPGMGPKSL